jgi:uncharacterized protein (UPF0332 family)
MSLNDEERKTMVGLEIEKADRFLKQADMMTDMEQLREKGDYNCLFEVTKEELLTFVEPAKELVEKIKQLIA